MAEPETQEGILVFLFTQGKTGSKHASSCQIHSISLQP